jgi:type I restriction enzyme S subunit
MKWNESTLGAVVDDDGGTIQTGPFGSQLHQHEYRPEGVPVIMPKDISDGRVSAESVARVSEQTANRLARHKLHVGAIVLPRRGEIAKRAFIDQAQEDWLCGTGCLKIELAAHGRILPEFLYYYMEQHAAIRWLEQHAVGTTMLNLNTEIVGDLPVRYPNLDVQREIVRTLESYKELIENNRRRIALLEQAARLLYEEWFVRFRFPGHEHVKKVNGLPVGWKRPTLGEYAPFQYGKALREDQRADGDVPVYGSSGRVGTHNKPFVDEPGIIVGRKGNVGAVYFSEVPFWPIDTTYYIDNENVSRFLFYALQRLQFINTDVAVPGLNRGFAHSRELIVPTDPILSQYEEKVAPPFSMAKLLERQNTQLQAARDLLLPRLMSGEVEV